MKLHSDPALYMFLLNGVLEGLSGGHFDDLIRAGDEDFREMSKKTNEIFEMASDENIPCTLQDSLVSRQGGKYHPVPTRFLKKL